MAQHAHLGLSLPRTEEGSRCYPTAHRGCTLLLPSDSCHWHGTPAAHPILLLQMPLYTTPYACHTPPPLPPPPPPRRSPHPPQILNVMSVPFETVNILEDDRLRTGMKEYSQWPTFPQVGRAGGGGRGPGGSGGPGARGVGSRDDGDGLPAGLHWTSRAN